MDRILKPHWAAILLGLVLALSLVWNQKGLHVAGIFSLWCPATAEKVPLSSPSASDSLFCSPHASPEDKGWLVWMVGGIFLGGFLSAFGRTRKLHLFWEIGHNVSPQLRASLAALGGLGVGVGAAMASGCTSSLGLTGSALFSVAAFAFLLAFFVGGFLARAFFGRFWL